MTATLPRFEDIQVGDRIPVLQLPPISRLTLALYCGASGDHNPIHVDSDFAKSAGMPDVFAHGMLSMAWLSRLLTDWVPQHAIRNLSVRFAAITQVHEKITCTAEVTEKFEADGERRVRLALTTANEGGQVKLAGDAVIALG
ncbi:MAG: MaoC family dehydratase [Serpentinimonas sp.]|nr:MaoC family dehydratase [Serpentinimonas sp.]